MAEELSTEVEILVPIKIKFKGRPKGLTTSTFGEKFDCRGEEAEQQNLPECHGHRMGSGLEYRTFFNDHENLTVEIDINDVFDIALRRSYVMCEENEDVVAIADAYREEDELKVKQNLIKQIQEKQKERQAYES